MVPLTEVIEDSYSWDDDCVVYWHMWQKNFLYTSYKYFLGGTSKQ